LSRGHPSTLGQIHSGRHQGRNLPQEPGTTRLLLLVGHSETPQRETGAHQGLVSTSSGDEKATQAPQADAPAAIHKLFDE
jgi:hypothetical protein